MGKGQGAGASFLLFIDRPECLVSIDAVVHSYRLCLIAERILLFYSSEARTLSPWAEIKGLVRVCLFLHSLSEREFSGYFIFSLITPIIPILFTPPEFAAALFLTHVLASLLSFYSCAMSVQTVI